MKSGLRVQVLALLVILSGLRVHAGCRSDEHECSHGLCIPRSWTCDNYVDCGDADNSDEDYSLCAGNYSNRYCGQLRQWSRHYSCGNSLRGSLSADNATLDGSTAIYVFTAPRSSSNATFLRQISFGRETLVPLNETRATLIINITMPSSSRTSSIHVWLIRPNTIYVNKYLRVPLRFESEETILVSVQYKEDFMADSLALGSETCAGCVRLDYITYSNDCECALQEEGYGDWLSRVSILDSAGVTCDITSTEYNEILHSLYDKCLVRPAEFIYVSPNVSSFLGDTVTLKCIGRGIVFPLVEWRDDESNVKEAGYNNAHLKVKVSDTPQRFRCVLNGASYSNEVTVAKWSSDCENIYQDLRGYRSGGQCHSSYSNRTVNEYVHFHSINWHADFAFRQQGVAHRFSLVVTTDAITSGVILYLYQTYNLTLHLQGSSRILYHRHYIPDYLTVENLNASSVKLDFEIVPPILITSDQNLDVYVESEYTYHVGELLRYYTVNEVTSGTLKSLACTAAVTCGDFYTNWTRLEADFQESMCGDGHQQEYMVYRQCEETQRPAPALRRSAPCCLDIPGKLRFYTVDCAILIDNAYQYEWYRIGANNEREFLNGQRLLIFENFYYGDNQGSYICIGRGGNSYANVTLEYQVALIQSDSSSFKTSMQLPNENFTDDLSDSTSTAFYALRNRVNNKMRFVLDMYSPDSDFYGARSEVLRFYPGSVYVDVIVNVNHRNNSDKELERSLHEALASQSSTDPESDPQDITVITLTSCPYEVLTIAGKELTFTQTRIGASGKSLEYCIFNTNSDVRALASRSCSGDFNSSANWNEPEVHDCGVEISDLENTNVTEDNVDEVAQVLEALTKNESLIDADSVSKVVDILDRIVDIGDPSPEVTSNVVNVVNNLIESENANLNDNGDDASRVVLALQLQVSAVLDSRANFTGVTSSLAVVALNVPPSSVANGLSFVATKSEGNDSLKDDNVEVYYSESEVPEDQVETSIELPKELLQIISSGACNSTVPISFVLYQNDNLFSSKIVRDSESATDSRKYIASSVIAATVECGVVQDLPKESPIVSTFRQNQEEPAIQNIGQYTSNRFVQCVFWDFNSQDGIGDWSTKGCQQVESVNGRIICHCTHATSFAVLVDIHGQKFASFALDVISKVGCGVSIVALVITIVVYLSIKSVRQTTASRILLSFCFSLLCLYVIFLAGIEQTSSRVGCTVVAVLLHYFTLTSMFWMGVEALNLYLKLIKLFNADIRHFMIKASIAAWGTPILVIIVILSVDYTHYGNENSCFLRPGPALYYGQLLIIGFVLLFNLIVFVLVIRKFTCVKSRIESSSSTNKRSEVVKRLQNMVTISVLLGLTWVFGLLSVFSGSNLFFQVLFCVFNSLQGFFIFVLFVVRQKKIRSILLGLVPSRDRPFFDSNTSRTGLKSTSTTNNDQSSVDQAKSDQGQDNPVNEDLVQMSPIAEREQYEPCTCCD